MAKKVVSYKGKNYEVNGTTEFNGRKFYKLATLPLKVSEIHIEKKLDGVDVVSEPAPAQS